MKRPFATMLRCALAAVLLCGAAVQAHAISITTTKSEYVPGGVRYYFEVTSWGNELSNSPCSTNESVYTICRVELSARIASSYNRSVGDYASWEVSPRRNSNMGQLLKDLENKGFRIPLRGSIFVDPSYPYTDLCIGFTAAITGGNIAAPFVPFGPCVRVAVPSLQCDFGGNGVIDHKTLMDNAVNGATASTQVNVRCQGPASITVSTSQTNAYGVRLTNDGSLYSRITINGKDATAGINVPITPGSGKLLTITSTLVKRGNVMPGAFFGSTVVTVSPP
ncbi:hypothetical protein ACNFB1_05160 [Pseudomonas sp. NY15349]|uniref:MrpH family fimbial adhesin n=1 Tax=Pseudomonas sp. NY15349 TaxID=3400350 RepID=UPI003A8BCAA2